MFKLEITDYQNNVIVVWGWQKGKPIPEKGDTLLFNNDDGEEYRASVIRREFDGTNDTGIVVRIVTDFVKISNGRKRKIDETLLP